MLDEQHLRWTLDKFIRCYNARRPHRAKGLQVLSGGTAYSVEGEVARNLILGGLIGDYFRIPT